VGWSPPKAPVLPTVGAPEIAVEQVEITEVSRALITAVLPLAEFGKRGPKGLCPHQSSGGGLPFGSRAQRTKSRGHTSPKVKVMPPMTTFRRLWRLRAL
jgi:hypothetical protein